MICVNEKTRATFCGTLFSELGSSSRKHFGFIRRNRQGRDRQGRDRQVRNLLSNPEIYCAIREFGGQFLNSTHDFKIKYPIPESCVYPAIFAAKMQMTR